MCYVERSYRNKIHGKNLISFHVGQKESDLYISVDEKSYDKKIENLAHTLLLRCREGIEGYLALDPLFLEALTPLKVPFGAPRIIKTMSAAAERAAVGPMAAVAGAVAEVVGRGLLRCAEEVIVENGGDIFMKTTKERIVSIFAGPSCFSERLGIKVAAGLPLGICTSSGTVGHSLSFGKADAAVVLSKSAPLADAVATAAGNKVNSPVDFPEVMKFACNIRGVEGIALIQGKHLGACGNLELIDLNA